MRLRSAICSFVIILTVVGCTAQPPTMTPTTQPPTTTPTTQPPALTPTPVPPTEHPSLPEGAVARVQCGHTVLRIFYPPDSVPLSVADSLDIRTCEIDSSEPQATILVYDGPVNMPGAVALSPDGKRLAIGTSDDGVVRIWDVATGEELATFEVNSMWIKSLAWSPDGEQLASASGPADDLVQVWDASTGKELVSVEMGWNSYSSVAWSPDGERLAVGYGGGGTTIWDGATGEKLASFYTDIPDTIGQWVNSVAWSPNGERLAVGLGSAAEEHGVVQIFDSETGESLAMPRAAIDVMTVAWSPNGDWLAGGSGGVLPSGSADGDNTVRVWDTATWEELAVFSDLVRGAIFSLMWSPDGKYLASGSADGTVILWDASRLLP